MRQPAVRTGEVTRTGCLSVHHETDRRRDSVSRRRVVWGDRARAVLGLLLVGAASTACYTYTPVSLAAVQSNEDVRLRVTEAAAARLSAELGTFSTEVDGKMSRRGPDSIAVGVAIARAYRGVTVGTTTQSLLLLGPTFSRCEGASSRGRAPCWQPWER